MWTFDTRLLVPANLQAAAGLPPFAIGSWPVEWARSQSKALKNGQTQKMIGEIQGELVLTPFEQIRLNQKSLNRRS